MSVREIEVAIEQLPTNKVAELMSWLAEHFVVNAQRLTRPPQRV